MGSLNTSAQLCCNNHPKLGACKPGVDDQGDGKCWLHCISGCEKGGFCKQVGNGHVLLSVIAQRPGPSFFKD
ncbi:unnamed protein product [Citrullus colocynthis]|uniref:Uncharacterized protein n=1 Tax=Citrullus colocynthis TaxID=252529 RepID=A0ABP0Z6C9_9ROSI